MKTLTLAQLVERFPTEDACKAYLAEKRWPEGKVVCPNCGNVKVWALKARPFHWVCKACNKNGYRFSVISRTIFDNTKYPLREWFKVIFLMSQSKKGMSALQIQRTLGMGSYETAWYMCHRVRAAMKNVTWGKLMGEVEVDETYVGGKPANWHQSKRRKMREGRAMFGPFPQGPKVGVIGAIARKGNVVCQVIERADTPTLTRFVRETVSENVSLVSTDEWAGYGTLGRKMLPGVPHGVVKHGAGQYVKEVELKRPDGEYVRGVVHTQTLDNFWSLLKRGIVGNYHQVSKKYLPLYLSEFTYRHNHRKDPDLFGSIVARC
jgi:transposase-like protein